MNGLVKNDKQLLTRNNEEADNFDIAIADGTYKSLSQKPVLAWDAERYLYKKLSENPNYVSKHKSFKEFLSRVDNKIVGKLHKIEKDIRDNTQYSEAQSIISTDRQNRSAELGKKLKELSIRKADRIELKQFEDERKNC